MSSTIKEFGGNTRSLSTGENNYIWNDKNNDGVVNKGDVLVRTAQDKASVYTYTVGSKEAMVAWGDPHLDNLTYTPAESERIVQSYKDAFEGRAAGEETSAAKLAAMDQAVTTTGDKSNIMDFHGNMRMVLDDQSTALDFGVYNKNKIAHTDCVDIHLKDANGEAFTITVDDIYTGNGGKGQSRISDTTTATDKRAVAVNAKLPEFYELKGANVMNEAMMFGDDAGTKDNAHVVDDNGDINRSHGKVDMATYKWASDASRGDTERLADTATKRMPTSAEAMDMMRTERERQLEREKERARERALSGPSN
jgi:hypothetical protein